MNRSILPAALALATLKSDNAYGASDGRMSHRLLFGLLCSLLAACTCTAALAFPTKPIRLVVGFPPGGPVDTVARIVALRLGPSLGQAIVIENRPGADANIAMETVARATPDGHTLLLIQPGVAINPGLYARVPFDPLRSFAPVSLIGESPNLIAVHNALPATSIAELVRIAREKPGALNYGATSSPTHLATELFNGLANIKTTRVPFRGAPPAFTALMAGDVQIVISGIGTLLPLAKGGKVRALAVTGAKRSALAPEIPTAIEAGVPEFVATTWYGLAAPAGTPPAVIARLNTDLRKVLAEPEIRSQLAVQGIDEPSPSTPEVFQALIAAEVAKWARVIKAAGAKLD